MTFKRVLRYMCLISLLVIIFPSFSPALAQEEDLYRISPRDTLLVSVWKDESLKWQIVVPPDCVISFPLIEDIKARDMTVAELRDVLTKRLAEFIPDPTVTVMLMTANSMTAYVIGKVMKPGEFPIGMESNVMQLLAMAGGLNPFAASTKIFILRQAGKKAVTIPFNYEQVLKGEKIEQNILLKRGDVVVVP